MDSITGKNIASLKDLQRQIRTKRYLMSVLEFDGETVAPANGAAARAEAMGALAGEMHELLTSDAAVELVAALEESAATEGLDPQTAAELRVFARDQREARAIPTDEEIACRLARCKAGGRLGILRAVRRAHRRDAPPSRRAARPQP